MEAVTESKRKTGWAEKLRVKGGTAGNPVIRPDRRIRFGQRSEQEKSTKQKAVEGKKESSCPAGKMLSMETPYKKRQGLFYAGRRRALALFLSFLVAGIFAGV